MGNNYAMALGASMKYMKAKKVSLPGNRISNTGAQAIFSNLSDNLKHLDLSNNNIGVASIVLLTNWIEKMMNK
jgi:Ran GTPase-activating protein (RanGAP) involved in mRNA processing and transport